MTKLNIEQMTAFCKAKGFVYPGSDIYGGTAGFWDYGHLGAELVNNLKASFWKRFVHERDDIIGIDGAIITDPIVWEASGHVSGFGDALLDCKKCNTRFRADHLIEEALKINVDGMSIERINDNIKKHNIVCPDCNGELSDARQFGLMFKTQVGPIETESSIAYLRPETAQTIFTNFKAVAENARMKLPFGILQTGKAFRNEIAPRNFLFRMREFEQMEIEYFIDPKKINDCPYYDDIKDNKILVYTAEQQAKNENHAEMTMEELYEKGIVKSKWHSYWLWEIYKWFVDNGAKPENFRLREHIKDELAHYAAACLDIEYNFPFGWKELHGMADRTTFDMDQHIKFSKKDLALFDQETKQKIVPHVVEPSQGVDRALLVFMFDAYHDDKKRGNVVLKLHPKLAPYKAAVFPLVNKDGLPEKAKEVFNELRKEFNCFYDDKGSIGRRYSRQDESGTPYTITVDYDSLKNNDTTIRDRDSTKQIRVKIDDLRDIIRKLINEEIKFEKAGKLIK